MKNIDAKTALHQALEHVPNERRDFLLRILEGTVAVAALPLTVSTEVSAQPAPPGKGYYYEGGKGGGYYGKGDNYYGKGSSYYGKGGDYGKGGYGYSGKGSWSESGKGSGTGKGGRY